MSTILQEIVAWKKDEIRVAREKRPLAELERVIADLPAPRGFAAGLASQAASAPAVIAEIKRGSPSLGCIRPDLDAPQQASWYEAGGAAALSCLTDNHFFFANPEDFDQIRQTVRLPMLRKDFMIDAYQIAESRAMGADCILLIMANLDDHLATELADVAHGYGLDVLCETHNAEEIHRALDHVDFDLLGINNRNLNTFETREETTLELAALVPDRDKLVAESGLHRPEALGRCWRSGIKRFLIGEAFVRATNPEETVRRFISEATRSQPD